MSAMYQQIATFGKIKRFAATQKISPKDNYQNDLDTFLCEFIYGYGQ